MSMALMIGAALAVVSLAYVLYPLVAGRSAPPAGSFRRREASEPVTEEELEAAIRAYRATHIVGSDCAVCGPRPEPDAVFCSNCGCRLVDKAPSG